ncbi:MAG TPA: GGDEF domain-containing protein, partial [Spirochaetota bacterium]|nr:GGDEF domain-containing protein [Spirochaetota bacterium]
DFFKRINDNYGHKTGDLILKKIVEISSSIIRKSDCLFRVGGEEFCIILSGAALESGIQVSSKIRQAIEEYNFTEKIKVTMSFGVAEALENENSDSLFKRADNCLYAAKNGGRNQVWASKGDGCFLA